MHDSWIDDTRSLLYGFISLSKFGFYACSSVSCGHFVAVAFGDQIWSSQFFSKIQSFIHDRGILVFLLFLVALGSLLRIFYQRWPRFRRRLATISMEEDQPKQPKMKRSQSFNSMAIAVETTQCMDKSIFMLFQSLVSPFLEVRKGDLFLEVGEEMSITI